MGTRPEQRFGQVGIVAVAALSALLSVSASRAFPQGNSTARDAAPRAEAADSNNLRILYAGRPGSDREKDFVSFLKKHFSIVQTGNLETFKEADTQGFDVTLLDWDANVLDGPYPKVSEAFARPLITLGVRGGLICRRWELKTGYL
jgi:hypothetical protein